MHCDLGHLGKSVSSLLYEHEKEASQHGGGKEMQAGKRQSAKKEDEDLSMSITEPSFKDAAITPSFHHRNQLLKRRLLRTLDGICDSDVFSPITEYVIWRRLSRGSTWSANTKPS